MVGRSRIRLEDQDLGWEIKIKVGRSGYGSGDQDIGREIKI